MSLLVTIGLVIFVCFGLTVFRGSPYVPSHKRDVMEAFDNLYQIRHDDVLVDIGSGDGQILREAARRGAKKCIGYEINPVLVILSKYLCRRYPQTETKMADFWRVSLPNDTSIVYIFSVTRDIERLTKKIQSESNRLNRLIHVIGYGSEFKTKQSKKQVGASFLYEFKPLHSKQAQV